MLAELDSCPMKGGTRKEVDLGDVRHKPRGSMIHPSKLGQISVRKLVLPKKMTNPMASSMFGTVLLRSIGR